MTQDERERAADTVGAEGAAPAGRSPGAREEHFSETTPPPHPPLAGARRRPLGDGESPEAPTRWDAGETGTGVLAWRSWTAPRGRGTSAGRGEVSAEPGSEPSEGAGTGQTGVKNENLPGWAEHQGGARS